MSANPNQDMVNFRLKDLDLCNHFNGKKAQAVSTRHIQRQTAELVAALVVTGINSIRTYANNTLEGRWQGVIMEVAAKCPRPTSSHVPHNRLPRQPQVHLTTTFVPVDHLPPTNSRLHSSEVMAGMIWHPPKFPHTRGAEAEVLAGVIETKSHQVEVVTLTVNHCSSSSLVSVR